MKRYLGFGIFLLFVGLAHASIFGPSNFDECVLDSMKGVTSDTAAGLIARSCRQKFPVNQTKHSTRALAQWELAAITGRGGPSYSPGYFNADLLNGNKGVTIAQVTISVTTKIGGRDVTNSYDVDVDIAPNKTGNIFFKFIQGDPGSKYEWTISAAKGY